MAFEKWYPHQIAAYEMLMSNPTRDGWVAWNFGLGDTKAFSKFVVHGADEYNGLKFDSVLFDEFVFPDRPCVPMKPAVFGPCKQENTMSDTMSFKIMLKRIPALRDPSEWSPEHRALMNALDTLGVVPDQLVRYAKQSPRGFVRVVCNTDQFARFLINRHELGGENWFSELDPKLTGTAEENPVATFAVSVPKPFPAQDKVDELREAWKGVHPDVRAAWRALNVVQETFELDAALERVRKANRERLIESTRKKVMDHVRGPFRIKFRGQTRVASVCGDKHVKFQTVTPRGGTHVVVADHPELDWLTAEII